MQKMKFDGVEEVLYYEKLDNGLEVYMVPKRDKNNFYVTYTTKYGSVYNEFVPINKTKHKKFPYGIAHFLEHKMFEQESGVDPFTFFSKSGTEANAGTSYNYTSYLFEGSKNFKENLEYLLDYVGSPYFTDENVEKEKGIIEQEIKMYDDNAHWVLKDVLRANMFSVHPIKKSIAGTIDSINSITKEDLYECYNTFYHPSNMILVITGNFDEEEAIKIVRDNQSKKVVDKLGEIKVKKYDEPYKIVKEYEEKEMIVETPKISVGIKIPLKKLERFNSKKRNLYLGVIGHILFGETSLFYEKMRESELLTTPLYVDKLQVDNYMLATITVESNKAKEIIEEIKKQLQNVEINENDFDRVKKLLISNFISLFDNINSINDKLFDNIINYNMIHFDEIDIIKSLTLDELNEVIKVLDLTNISVYVIKPKKENI